MLVLQPTPEGSTLRVVMQCHTGSMNWVWGALSVEGRWARERDSGSLAIQCLVSPCLSPSRAVESSRHA